MDTIGANVNPVMHRSDFPKGFVFGSATAAFQVEGAANEGGRSPCVWDTFCRTPGKVEDMANADVSADQYHHYETDVDNLKSIHMDAYRFSISWSRILPDGRGPEVNKEGAEYYNKLIDCLLSRGIEPYVTLYHWDLPQILEDSIGGWLSPEIVDLFANFAETCYSLFGDRVKNWITFNEPHNFCYFGYGLGIHAPGRTSDRSLSPAGNSLTDPYIAGRHTVLAHAKAVDILHTKFPGKKIGIAVDAEWGEPLTNSPEDVAATERRNLYQLGWFLDPLYFGDYPQVMKDRGGPRIPPFSDEEKSLLRKGVVDFIGVNNYTTKWIKHIPSPEDPAARDFWQDQSFERLDTKDGVRIGPSGHLTWLCVVPWGFENLLMFLWNRYKTPMFVTENGLDSTNLQLQPDEIPRDSIEDFHRIGFFQEYLDAVLKAISKGADIRGYFAWSLVDNFEWQVGYRSRFGIFYVDYFTLKRYPKLSAKWWGDFLEDRSVSTNHK